MPAPSRVLWRPPRRGPPRPKSLFFAWRRAPRRPPGQAGGSGPAQRPAFVGQRLPLVSPCPLLLAFFGDHLGGCPRDEILVAELGVERRQLLLEPGELAREAATLLPHVDRVRQSDEHFTAVGEHGVGAFTTQTVLESQIRQLRQPDDGVAFFQEGHSDRVGSRLDWRREAGPVRGPPPPAAR